jgi:NlpC/P60 family
MLTAAAGVSRKSPAPSQLIIWLAALGCFGAIIFFPVSNRVTRVSTVVLLSIVWFGLISLCWRWRVLRFAILGIPLLAGSFLALPARRLPNAEVLRVEYIDCLRRYNGTQYVWGGENFRGIDCSGLIRRGLIDSLFCRGVLTLDPGLVRRALSLWWKDCSASALGQTYDGLTIRQFDTPSVNQLDHSKVLPGDLAVTRDGTHIMAYLGEQTWIEADPGEMRVITVTAPARDNVWFDMPMNVVRWRLLSQ